MTNWTVWLRRIVQTLFLGLWGLLFYQTAEQGLSAIPPDLFLVSDPLAGFLSVTAARVWVSKALWGCVLVGLTLIFGRFFCGWICPLGTVLDVFGRLWKGDRETTLKNDGQWRRLKYYLLVLVAMAALAGGQLVYWADPLVLSFRAVAMGFGTGVGHASFLPLLILLVIIGLTSFTHRFWCRYLCPMGAFYGAVARFSLFRRRRDGCDGCRDFNAKKCQQVCAQNGSVMKHGMPEECVRCMRCESVCQQEALSFDAVTPIPDPKEKLVLLDRRTFMVSSALGATAGVCAAGAQAGNLESWRRVRPPMISDDVAFSALCVRCGQCIRSCPTGTLQPLFLEGGFSGLWTPAITPHVGGCKDDCNRCSNVCPTGAIPTFGPSRAEKWSVKMGSVVLERHRCISYADDAKKPCLKCVEICPNKAIQVDADASPVRPVSVLYDRCVGCGLCEFECLKMVTGESALILNRNGAGSPAALVVDPKPNHVVNEED